MIRCRHQTHTRETEELAPTELRPPTPMEARRRRNLTLMELRRRRPVTPMEPRLPILTGERDIPTRLLSRT